MNRISHRESILMGYAPNPTSSSPQSVMDRDSDVDFNDVFGGPPRRSSINETRYSGIEVNGPNDENPEDEFPSCPWPRALTMSEKPVFGEESSHRKRNPSDDFFDDIFSKDESSSSTPRRGYERERDPFASSTPGSRGLSPARPLPPRAEPFLSSSLPSQFSLPARVTKGMDFPTFGSPIRTPQSKKNNYNIDGGHHSPTRFQDSKQVYRQSPLSQEVATSHDNEASSKVTPEEIDEGIKLKQELSDSNFQFHFSIYKWASKGVPFAMPLKQGKEKGRHVTSFISKEQMPTVTPQNCSDSPLACGKSSTTSRAKDDYKPSSQVYEILPRESETVEEATLLKVQSATSNTLLESTKQIQVNNAVYGRSRNESSSASANARGSTVKSQLRPLRSLLSESDDEGALPLRPAGDSEIRKGDCARQNKAQNTKKSTFVFNGVNEKKKERKITVPDAVNVDKFIPQVIENTSIKNPGKNAVKGKVNEFVRMFNQESSPKPKDFVISHSQDVTPNRSSSGEVNRIQEYLRQFDQEKVAKATEDPDISLNPSHEYTAVDITGPTIADTDQYLQINFMIKELAQEEINLLETQDNHEEVKVIDAKIRQWSTGKEGNIRSLLSTLQHVLWPGSGWKTVPLVDIIEGSAVKRAYQRALLCLHPDKLQQKGAATHQKYTAERVFDILQEAWNQFNLLGAV